MINVALQCIQMNPTDRPSMDAVIQMLEGEAEPPEILPAEPSLKRQEIHADDVGSSGN